MSEPHRSRNTMFWRRDEFVAAASKHPGWAPFHRACGQAGLFFDDIDPVGDDGKKDVTKRPTRGYGAVTFRLEGTRAFHVSKGKGESPIAAVIDAYRKAIEAGFEVPAGLEAMFDDIPAAKTPPPPPPPAPVEEIDDDIMGLIG